eukprot:12404619-Karenia_brevis.AAC.1
MRRLQVRYPTSPGVGRSQGNSSCPATPHPQRLCAQTRPVHGAELSLRYGKKLHLGQLVSQWLHH